MKLNEIFQSLLERLTNLQTRVNKGMKTQKSIASTIKQVAPESRVVKYAPGGSKGADIVMNVGGQSIQIEAKVRATPAGLIKIIEETVKRGQPGVRLLPALTRLGYPQGLTQYIDTMRKQGKPAGFTGDEGAPPSGSIGGTVRISDPAICASLRKQFIQQLQQGGDNYFAIETASTGDIGIYYTGLGPNVLDAPPIPKIKFAVLDTYGSATTHQTVRVAVKAMFSA